MANKRIHKIARPVIRALNGREREPSLLATSEAVRKQHAERRGTPIEVGDKVRFVGLAKLTVRQMYDLGIDDRYQRSEITAQVNTLIHVIKDGGVIPDPITVAERPDGSRWIVDGQQRFWAHLDTEKPIQAMVYKVNSFDDELALFNVLNNNVRLTAAARIAAWPGEAGKIIRDLADNPSSPLYRRVSLIAASGGAIISTPPLLRGLTTAISNVQGNGGMERVLTTFDRAYKKDPNRSNMLAYLYATVIANVFVRDGGSVLRYVPAIAFGRVCYEAFGSLKKPEQARMPSDGQYSRLRKINWDRIAPSAQILWLPTAITAIQQVWRVGIDMVQFAADEIARK
jgi:hypothetical protein